MGRYDVDPAPAPVVVPRAGILTGRPIRNTDREPNDRSRGVPVCGSANETARAWDVFRTEWVGPSPRWVRDVRRKGLARGPGPVDLCAS